MLLTNDKETFHYFFLLQIMFDLKTITKKRLAAMKVNIFTERIFCAKVKKEKIYGQVSHFSMCSAVINGTCVAVHEHYKDKISY